MKKILILKRSAFGDIVHTLPVIPAIRKKYPQVRITWVTELGFGAILRAQEGLDEVVELGFRSMLRRKRLRDFRKTLKDVSSQRYDALIDFQGTLKSWMLLASAKAERKIGFNRADAREPATTRFYTEQVKPMPYGLHVIRQYLRLLRPLGIESEEIRYPRIHLNLKDEDYVEKFITDQKELDNGKEFIAVNPFTNWKTKCWPAGNTADFCKLVRNETDFVPLLIWGPKERKRVEQIVDKSAGASVLAPETSLAQLAALLQRARLYVGGDTGPTHLATALRIPVVALFGPTDYRRNGPIYDDDEILSLGSDCKGCKRNRCKKNELVAECMLRITARMVLEAAVRRLERSN